jgi:hypothetical protein
MKPGQVRTVLVAGLVMSIGANVLLFATRTRAPTSSVDDSLPGGESDQPQVSPTVVPTHASSEPLSKMDREKLEQRLLAAEAKLETLLPVSEKWARGIRSPQAEERARPFLDKLFDAKPNGAARPYDFECRDQICKLTVNAGASGSGDWLNVIQSDPEALRLFQFRSVGGNTAFVLLRDPRSGASVSLMARIATAFQDSRAIADCKKQNPAPGTMTLTVSLDTAGRRLRTTAAGQLADQPGGICIVRAAEDVFATIAIPSDVTSLPDLPIPVSVP